jgi:hypothetical protein
MKRTIAIILCVAFFASFAFAAGDYGTPGEFLNWGAGARALGLGRAFTGLADDPSAIYYNPAGLALQNPLQITLQHAALFYDTMYDFAAITYPVSGIGTFAGSLVSLRTTGFDPRNNIWESPGTGNFSVTNQAYIISYAKDITPWFAAGANLKLINEQVYNESGLGYGLDIGALLTPANYFSFGLSIINLVPASVKLDQTAESFPVTIRAGIAFKLLNDRIIPVFDIVQELSKKDFKFSMGLEAYPIQDLALRAGIDESEYTFGIGYFLKPVRVDYSLSTSTQDLGLTNRISVTLAFGGFDINLKADPKMFSMVGIKKNTTISIYAVTKNPISEWELDAINEDGDVVRTYNGDDNPPTSIIWDGKDDRGLPVGDGEYKFVMKIKDTTGKSIESGKETVKISSTIPMQPGSIKLEE